MAPSWMSRALNPGYSWDIHSAEFCARHPLRAGRANRTLPCDHIGTDSFEPEAEPSSSLNLRPVPQALVQSTTASSGRAPVRPLKRRCPHCLQSVHSLSAQHSDSLDAQWSSRRPRPSGHKLGPVSPCSPAKRKPRLWLPLCWLVTAFTLTRLRRIRSRRSRRHRRGRAALGGSRAGPLARKPAWCAACCCHRGRCLHTSE